MPISSTSPATRNYLLAIAQEIRQKEQERARKVGNIQAGVRGGVDAYATGQLQDNIASLQQPQNPYGEPGADAITDPMTGDRTGSYNDPSVPAMAEPSALSKLDTGGYFGRVYGGLMGTDAYKRQMQGPMDLALLQDRQTREDAQRQQDQQWRLQRDRQQQQAILSRYKAQDEQAAAVRAEKIAQQVREREAVGNAYGMQGADPNIPVSALDNLYRMAEDKAATAEETRRQEAFSGVVSSGATPDTLSSAPGFSDLSPEDMSRALSIVKGQMPPDVDAPTLTPEERAYQTKTGNLRAESDFGTDGDGADGSLAAMAKRWGLDDGFYEPGITTGAQLISEKNRRDAAAKPPDRGAESASNLQNATDLALSNWKASGDVFTHVPPVDPEDRVLWGAVALAALKEVEYDKHRGAVPRHSNAAAIIANLSDEEALQLKAFRDSLRGQ